MIATVLLVLVSIALSSCAGVVSSAAKGNGGSGSGSGSGAGSGTAPSGVATLSASATSLNCGSVAVGSSTTQSVTITNIGTDSAAITQAPVAGTGFSIVGSNLPATMAAGASATVQIQFAPTADGSATGSYSIASDATNSPMAIALTGMGTSTGFGVSPGSISFGSVAVGSSNLKTVTVTNTGNTSVAIQLVTPSGTGFSVSGISTPTNVAAGGSATFSAVFAPTSTGSATGSISISANAPGSPATIALTGSATQEQAQLTLSATNEAFGSVNVGGSASKSITVTNSGNAALTITSATATGTGFSISGLGAQTINAGASTSFAAQFAPTTAGSDSGSISIISNAPNSPASITLSATAVQTQPIMLASSSSLSFGNVNVGASSSQNITLTNSGNAALTILSATATGTGFSISGIGAQTINAGASATFAAQFAPTTAGGATGNISIVSNAAGSPMNIPLTGSGAQGVLSVSPTSESFGNVAVGSNGSKSLTLTNTGTASVTVSSASASGTGFGLSGLSTPVTVSAGQSVPFLASFTPTTPGVVSGGILLGGSGSSFSLSVPLTGTGTQPQFSATPASASFGSVTVGNSNSQTITLSNNGNATLTISSATVTGAAFSTPTMSTPMSIAAGGTAQFNVVFTPTASSAVSGTVSLVSNAPNSPLTIALTGSGTAASQLLSASPTTLSFGNLNDGTTSSLSVTLTNSGNADITISGVTTTSGLGFSASGVGSGVTLSANQTATLNVAFDPTSAGAVSGKVSVASNATNSPAVINVTGTGVASSTGITVSPTTLSFGSQTVNSLTGASTVTVTNTGNTSVTVSNVQTSAPFAVSGFSGSTTLSANQSLSLNVTFDPTSQITSSGTLTITSSAPSSPDTVALSGTGVAVTQPGTPDLTPPICGLTSNTSNIIPNATTWASFTPPAVGGTYTDAAYGCAVTRLTNASTDPGGVGEVHYYSLSNPLSAADTKVLIFDQNGNWHVVDTNGTVVVSTSNFGPGQGIPVWDVTNDNVFWRASGSTLEECTINTSAKTVSCVTNHTFSEYGYMVNIPDKGDMSPGGWINMLGQSSQGGSFDMFMYNPATGTKSPTFTEGSCDGDIADSEPGCLHSTTVFVGENMTADFESGTPSAAGIFWAAPFNASSFNTVDQGDHNDEGVYTDGATIVGVFEDYQPNPGPWGNCTHSYRPTIVTYSAAGAAVGKPSCMFDNMPSEPGWWVSFRDSVNRSWVAYSTQATSSAEYFNSDSSYAAPSSSNWLMYTGEILLVRADANNNPSLIYRLTLTHSRQQESGAYWAGPRAALSRSGNYVVFDSNAAWGQNGCGSINTCTDVYIIKLH